MYMKRISIILFSALVSYGLSSCDSRLDVQPTQTIDESQALSTSSGVVTTLLGAYDGLQDGDVYGGAIQYSADLLGDNGEVRFTGTFSTLDEIWRKSVTTTNTQITNTWSETYDVINRVNNVLSAIQIVEEDSRDQVEGEALFIRGALYFELVRLFGKAYNDGDPNANPGVPLVLTPTRSVTDADFVSRATVAAVYTQIISDLTNAETKLEDAEGGSTRATKQAASAMLSRVYLMQGNYAAARDAANRVIESEFFELTSDFDEVFNNNEVNGGAPTSENIFSIIVTTQDGVNDLNTFYASSGFGGRGDIRVLQKHRDLYAPSDVRGGFFYQAGTGTYTGKFTDQFGNVPIIRLAEMYLTRAEANFRLNTSIGATPVADVNAIRTRAGLTPLTTVTLNQILNERKLELAFEGHLLHDTKRTGQAVGSDPFSANRLVLPIPQRERDTNKNLTQNPGYAQ
jgi:hypothetical protein